MTINIVLWLVGIALVVIAAWRVRTPFARMSELDRLADIDFFEAPGRQQALQSHIDRDAIPLAGLLHVDAATIARDKAKIKAKERLKPAEPDQFDDGMAKEW